MGATLVGSARIVQRASTSEADVLVKSRTDGPGEAQVYVYKNVKLTPAGRTQIVERVLAGPHGVDQSAHAAK